MTKKEKRHSSFVRTMTTAVERRTPDETRACIMQVAWDLFREFGPRTTIADVADKAGMSSANVYRFFPSKQALNEAVCENLLAVVLSVARAQLDSPGPASQRIAGMMLALNRLMRDQMTRETRVHEVVQIAIDEHWTPIVDYIHKCAEMLATTIAEGQAAGEFGPGDSLDLAWRTMQACIIIHDPASIVSCQIVHPQSRPEDAVEFALRALANPHPPPPLPES